MSCNVDDSDEIFDDDDDDCSVRTLCYGHDCEWFCRQTHTHGSQMEVCTKDSHHSGPSVRVRSVVSRAYIGVERAGVMLREVDSG